ncbi:hypothetical protein [Mycobacteroides abscessus]|uniref:hypothetical protein n=1 Tax=Mycobacteroides abscessus TaxID=36809 RepID=UPI00092A8F4C|nr:hypothetical protein [Mycobacteroides abscessus]SHO82725.1 Uncharacterised protein [Mycobacteroides abscessus subsp. abscessus]SHP25751.1 Uncharacterised protein [Mycobacteroides abscessus subsp. abscessus]SHP71931.1 Uncharacterised protein [Mycobacteroides abscessus subsp. abscessus]SHQ92375.1 Uncharacterised protein [Mycobacteroides abscessus subsp. abscessus]SHQ99898.1 Uncharacterised protein [Mycobacteroides abscessus subsp. abscessus]
MSGTVATSGDAIVQMHKSVASSAREAALGLPTVVSAGMRAGHAGILEAALGDTRRVLTELARVADIGARGAGALADQDCESAGKFEGWDMPELEVRGAPQEIRVI